MGDGTEDVEPAAFFLFSINNCFCFFSFTHTICDEVFVIKAINVRSL